MITPPYTTFDNTSGKSYHIKKLDANRQQLTAEGPDLDQVNLQPPQGITIRSIIVGTLLCCLLAIVLPYNLTSIRGSNLALDHNAPGAIALFFILVAGVNTLLRCFAKIGGNTGIMQRLPFSQPELLTVYVMLVVCSALCTMGLGVQLPPIIAAPNYYLTGDVTYSQFVQGYGQSMPDWLIISDPGAAQSFYSGLPAGPDFWPQFTEIFLAHWLKPIAFWAIFLFALYAAMVCIAVIFRKQWVEREILVYPLTKVPLAMVESDPAGRLVNPLFRNKQMWIGFAIPALFATYIALANYFPELPKPSQLHNGAPCLEAQFFDRTLEIRFHFSFVLIAFAFLVSQEVSGSIWFFGLIGILLPAAMSSFGIRNLEYLGRYGAYDKPLFYHLGEGAVLMMVGFGLWTARDHLKEVFRKAFGLAPQVDDSNEILSYRTAVFGLIISFLIMLSWLYTSGMSLWLALVFLVLALALFFALTRVVAEAGLAAVVAPSVAPTSCVSTFGASAVGVSGLVSLALSYIWAADLRTFVMVPVSNGLKVFEKPVKNRRRLIWAIALAVLLGFVLPLSVVIFQAYSKGGINMTEWFFRVAPIKPFGYMSTTLVENPDPNIAGWQFAGLGALLMIGLLMARRNYAWWPIHPIGLIVMGAWMMAEVWFSFLLAWLIKTTLVKYGGPRLYNKSLPLFLGLIIGQFFIATLWVVIDFATGKVDNTLFWM